MSSSYLYNQVTSTSSCGINPAVIGSYFLPYSWNYLSVNGLLFSHKQTILLFQITLAHYHEIKSLKVAKLLKALPKTIKQISFIFVVPKDHPQINTKS